MQAAELKHPTGNVWAERVGTPHSAVGRGGDDDDDDMGMDAIVGRERERERAGALFRSLRQKKDGNFQTRKKATRNRAMSMAAISSLD